MLQPQFADNRRCSKCQAPAARLMETVYLDGKYSEQPCAVNTATGIATHLCTGACGNCKTYDQTYHADLSEVRECVTDPLNSRFTQERMDDAR